MTPVLSPQQKHREWLGHWNGVWPWRFTVLFLRAELFSKSKMSSHSKICTVRQFQLSGLLAIFRRWRKWQSPKQHCGSLAVWTHSSRVWRRRGLLQSESWAHSDVESSLSRALMWFHEAVSLVAAKSSIVRTPQHVGPKLSHPARPIRDSSSKAHFIDGRRTNSVDLLQDHHSEQEGSNPLWNWTSSLNYPAQKKSVATSKVEPGTCTPLPSCPVLMPCMHEWRLCALIWKVRLQNRLEVGIDARLPRIWYSFFLLPYGEDEGHEKKKVGFVTDTLYLHTE